MRKAMDKLGAFYKTQLGQNVVETGLGGAVAAGGQALFTDMSPEEIALSTAIGVGAAGIGRPIGGALLGKAGTMIDNRYPQAAAKSTQALAALKNQPVQAMADVVNARLAPNLHLSPSAQLGSFLGTAQGDNVAQALVALLAPVLVNIEKDPQ